MFGKAHNSETMQMQQAVDSDLMTVEVYAESGKWSWQCRNADGLPVCGGFGYSTEAEARNAALEFMRTLS